MIMREKQGKTCEIWYHGPCVKISSNLTRLKIETDRYIKNVVFATSFFHLVADLGCF